MRWSPATRIVVALVLTAIVVALAFVYPTSTGSFFGGAGSRP